MFTQLRLFLAQLILPKGYEVADSDYAEAMATKCYFRGKLEALTQLKRIMEHLYGTDWRDRIYNRVKTSVEYYSNLINNSSNEPEFEE